MYGGGSIQGSNTGLNQGLPDGPTWVPYIGFGSGGLNTRLDPHALDRTELAVSINGWSSYDQAISKRPGTTPLPGTVGGGGGAALGLASCRYNGDTYLLKLGADSNIYARNADASDSWHLLGAANASATFITAAQMFDPSTGKQSTIICTGFDVPQIWNGPSSYTLAPVGTGAGQLPSQYNNTGTPITPQFVITLGNNSHLVYSGEPTNPSAVYISDPFFPQSFTSFSMQVTVDPAVGAFQPAIIGNNDGVQGGNITGIISLQSTLVVFKETAIYAMVQTTLLGEVPAWQVVQVANDVGCLSPRSIVGYETFICFEAIDGAYITDANSVQQISGDVPTIFDNSVTGFEAVLTNRQLSIGVRCGMRYMLFYSTQGTNTPTQGIWFDFTKQSRFGNPLCGVINGMNVGGAVTLRSAGDYGTMAWVDALTDQEGVFGQGYGDLPGGTTAISVLLLGKADLYDDIFGAEAIVAEKVMQSFYILADMVNQTTVTQIDFYGTVVVDLNLTLARVLPDIISIGQSGGIWNVDDWNVMDWSGMGESTFGVVKVPTENAARGHLLQLGIQESSNLPWVIIGAAAYLNCQKADK